MGGLIGAKKRFFWLICKPRPRQAGSQYSLVPPLFFAGLRALEGGRPQLAGFGLPVPPSPGSACARTRLQARAAAAPPPPATPAPTYLPLHTYLPPQPLFNQASVDMNCACPRYQLKHIWVFRCEHKFPRVDFSWPDSSSRY